MTETATKPKSKRSRGRPCGSFGPRRRQKELVDQIICALGGPGNVSPWVATDIIRAVTLLSIAEERRRQIDQRGGTSDEVIALVRLEEVAQEAVDRLHLPASSSIKGVRTA